MSKKVPSYRLLKSRNLGYVEIGGRRTYLGKYATPESLQRYQRVIAEWQAGNAPQPKRGALIIADLALAYEDHAQRYYRLPDGSVSSIVYWITRASDTLVKLYGAEPASSLGPVRLQAVRQQWVQADLARTTCNKYTGCIKRMYKWAAAQELVPAEIYQALCSVDGLRRGKTEARESASREPCDLAHVAAVNPFLSRQVWAIIELLRLTCARPSEIAPLRPRDIDRTGPLWVADLDKHKTMQHGKRRVLVFGPQAQAVLRPFLLRDEDACLFTPAEAEEEGGRKVGARKFNPYYTADSLCQAVERACVKAKVPHWTPYQLRHTGATAVRAAHGIEAAQDVLGHANMDITLVYAQRSLERVKAIMLEMG